MKYLYNAPSRQRLQFGFKSGGCGSGIENWGSWVLKVQSPGLMPMLQGVYSEVLYALAYMMCCFKYCVDKKAAVSFNQGCRDPF